MIMELTYTKVGNYYIPDLALGDDAEYEIGVYGRMRERFLEEHHHGTYTSLLLTGKLWRHLNHSGRCTGLCCFFSSADALPGPGRLLFFI